MNCGATCLQFEFELAVARMVLGPDAEVLGGLLANSSGWLGASDETHCGKMATLKVCYWVLLSSTRA